MGGQPEVLLAALRYALTEFSLFVSSKFVHAGVRLLGKPLDAHLCQTMMRAILTHLDCRCRLTPSQFMSPGAFVELKLKFVSDVLRRCHAAHAEASKADSLAVLRVIPHVASTPPPLSAHYGPRYPTSHLRPASAAAACHSSGPAAVSRGSADEAALKWFSDSVTMGRGAWAATHSKFATPPSTATISTMHVKPQRLSSVSSARALAWD